MTQQVGEIAAETSCHFSKELEASLFVCFYFSKYREFIQHTALEVSKTWSQVMASSSKGLVGCGIMAAVQAGELQKGRER